jgi:ribokinase
MTTKEIDKSWSDIQICHVLLATLELSEDVLLYTLKKAKDSGIQIILNPTHAKKDMSTELLTLANIICPNKQEASNLSGIEIQNVEDAIEAAKIIRKKGGNTIIITLGSDGCILYKDDELTLLESTMVENIVDVSGIGDCWVGSLTYFIGCSIPIVDSIYLASYLSSLSLLKDGVQSSYPKRVDILMDGF